MGHGLTEGVKPASPKDVARLFALLLTLALTAAGGPRHDGFALPGAPRDAAVHAKNGSHSAVFERDPQRLGALSAPGKDREGGTPRFELASTTARSHQREDKICNRPRRETERGHHPLWPLPRDNGVEPPRFRLA